jgi:hypothetical protein
MRTNIRRLKITRLKSLYLLPLAAALFGFVNTTGAQTAKPTTTPQPAPTPQTTTEANLRINRVVESQIAVNHLLTIVIDDLDKWDQLPDHDTSKFVLYMDGNAFAGLQPALVDVKDAKGVVQKALRFDLLRTSSNKDAWTAVFSRRRPGEFSNRNVYVKVNQEGVRVTGEALANLRVIDWTGFVWFIFAALAFVALSLYLCYKSDMIRVPGGQPTGFNKKKKPNRKVYSLARTQMAAWFFVVLLSFVFIWVVTSNLSNLPGSILALIGISAATGLGSAVVDSSKKTDQVNLLTSFQEKRKTSAAEADKLIGETAALNKTLIASPPPADLAEQKTILAEKQGQLSAKQTEIAQTDVEIQKLTAALQPLPSDGFLNDILSDDDGVSFHRFQIVGWTVVLVLIFVVSVYDVLAMPDFDATLLALMGISGGTYIGFKLPAQQG